MKHYTKRIPFIPLLILLGIGLAGSSCVTTKTLDDPTTNATLWMQNAAEYKAITTTIYQLAASKLDEALQDSNQAAYINQQSQSYQSLPPAVILDVDETVLDNSPFQARLIKNHQTYTPAKWDVWVREAQADAIAGALAFTRLADGKGITVFYVTNRNADLEKATQENLRKLGFPLKENTDVLLLKNERPNWTSAKVNRRKFVAQKYRILMLIGDNLNDIVASNDMSSSQRNALIQKYKDKLGLQWFVLPNPVYGSWEQALYDFDHNLTPAQIEQRKMQQLHTKN